MRKQPNIVLIVADDMGYGDFGVFNDGPARTPCLDALVEDGVCLTQHYAGSPACSPSRAALLTGRYPHSTGAGELHQPLPANQVVFPALLKKRGYYTAAAWWG